MSEYRTSAIHESWKDREAAQATKLTRCSVDNSGVGFIVPDTKPAPKSILDPAFEYTPSHATNIRVRFERVRREQEERRK